MGRPSLQASLKGLNAASGAFGQPEATALTRMSQTSDELNRVPYKDVRVLTLGTCVGDLTWMIE